MKSQQPKPPEPSLEEKQAQALADSQKWAELAAAPGLSPQAAVVAANAARSSQAAAKAWGKAAAHKQGKSVQGNQVTPDYGESDPALLVALGLSPSPLTQLQGSGLGKAPSPTGLGTSESGTSPPMPI